MISYLIYLALWGYGASYDLVGDGFFRYQGILCVPDVEYLRNRILEEAHGSRYSIHPGATKIYHDLREIYWRDGLKRDIQEFVLKCPRCQQVKAENLEPGGLIKIMDVPTWKRQAINMDFGVGFHRTRMQNDFIWVIMDRLT